MKKYLMTALISILLISSAYGQNYHKNFDDNMTCQSCHKDYNIENVKKIHFNNEREIINNAFKHFDNEFGSKNCTSCHNMTCESCHEDKNHNIISKPLNDNCLICHKDVYTGIEYEGYGIREDHIRYKRGLQKDGEYYLKMIPSVHHEAGITCAECHTKKSLLGKEKPKDCLTCHTYDTTIIDHSIKGHDKVACISCHASYAPMELGTFYLRFRESSNKEIFSELPQLNDEYVKSSYMRVNERSPMVIDNETGKYVPAKPAFIIFTGNTYQNLVVGIENNMILNRWKKTYPHTVRRETVLCSACHDNEKAFLLESDENRVLYPDKDGLPIKSFYNSEKFSIEGARFVTRQEYNEKINKKSKEYIKKYMEKLDQLKKVIKESK